jgi:hypothetical protein
MNCLSRFLPISQELVRFMLDGNRGCSESGSIEPVRLHLLLRQACGTNPILINLTGISAEGGALSRHRSTELTPRRFPMNRCPFVRGEVGPALSCPTESPNVIATATLSGAGRTHSGPLTHGFKTAGSSRPSSPARHKARSRQAIGCSPGIYIAPGLTAAPDRAIGWDRVSSRAKPFCGKEFSNE